MQTSRLDKALKNLANSESWKVVRDEWILPEMRKLNNVYDDRLKLEMDASDFKAEYMAKIKAFGKIEMIILKIDKFIMDKDNRANFDQFE